MSYRVGMKTASDVDWLLNDIRFATEPEADGYRMDLFSRWTAVVDSAIFITPDPPNVRWEKGKVVWLIEPDMKIMPPETE